MLKLSIRTLALRLLCLFAGPLKCLAFFFPPWFLECPKRYSQTSENSEEKQEAEAGSNLWFLSVDSWVRRKNKTQKVKVEIRLL